MGTYPDPAHRVVHRRDDTQVTPYILAWDLLGVGKITEEVRRGTEAALAFKFKEDVLRTVTANLQTLIIFALGVMAVGSAWVAGYLVMRFFDTCREAMRDGRVTVSEWIVLGVESIVLLPTIFGLLVLAYYMGTAHVSGLEALKR